MKNVLDLLVKLYTIKLTNYQLIMDATISAHAINDMSNYEKIRIDDPMYQRDRSRNTLLAQKFISPVLYVLHGTNENNPNKQPRCDFQDELLILLQLAQSKGIIAEPSKKGGSLVFKDYKKFKTEVLQKCELPCYLSSNRDGSINYCSIDTITNVERFHSLTAVGLSHLIHEQMEQVLNEQFYKYKTFENGLVYDADVLYSALVNLRYWRFTNNEELENAVGTDGMKLARQIRDRMFERVTQPQKA